MADTIFDLSTTAASNSAFKTIGVLGSNLISTADDAFRNLGAMLAGYDKDLTGIGQTLGGTADAITLTVNQPWASIAVGQIIGFYYTTGPNTTAVTINVTPGGGGAAFGAKAIVNNGGAALIGGEMLDNGFYWIWYNGTAYVLLNPNVGMGTFQPLDADLTAIAALAGTNTIYYRSAANTWTAVTLGANMRFSGGRIDCLELWGGAISDETTAITTGTGKLSFSIPYAFTVVGVYATLNTVSSSGTPTFDINEAGTTILSTKIVIDVSELTGGSAGYQGTAAGAAVISDATIAAFAQITVDIDTAGTGAKGAKVFIIGYPT